MVYCSFLKVQNKIIRYSLGGYSDDLTGVLVVDMNNKSFYVEKEPEASKVYPRLIGSMLRKYLPELEKGEYPERMSYEI